VSLARPDADLLPADQVVVADPHDGFLAKRRTADPGDLVDHPPAPPTLGEDGLGVPITRTVNHRPSAATHVFSVPAAMFVAQQNPNPARSSHVRNVRIRTRQERPVLLEVKGLARALDLYCQDSIHVAHRRRFPLSPNARRMPPSPVLVLR
jgi:hypothetical protein